MNFPLLLCRFLLIAYFLNSKEWVLIQLLFTPKEINGKLEKEFGKQKLAQFKQTTKDLINGEMVTTNPPKQIQKPKFLGIF